MYGLVKEARARCSKGAIALRPTLTVCTSGGGCEREFFIVTVRPHVQKARQLSLRLLYAPTPA